MLPVSPVTALDVFLFTPSRCQARIAMWELLVFLITAVCLLAGLLYYKSHPAPPSDTALRAYYSQRIVWVTGASSGIGRALALRLAELGCLLVLSGRDQTALDRVKRLCEERRPPTQPPPTTTSTPHTYTPPASQPTVVVEPFDVGWIGSVNGAKELQLIVARVMKAYGRLDAVVCNAGVSMRGSVAETQLAVDHELMNTNYFGSVALTKALLPHLLNARSQFPATTRPPVLAGSLAYTSSVQGLLAVPHRSAYSASKHALHGFVHSLQYEQPTLHALLMCPGYVATSLSLHALAADGGKWGRMDDTTKAGMSAEAVVERMVAGWYRGEDEVWLCDVQAHVGIWLQWIAPALLKSIMRKRGEKEQAANAANRGRAQ